MIWRRVALFTLRLVGGPAGEWFQERTTVRERGRRQALTTRPGQPDFRSALIRSALDARGHWPGLTETVVGQHRSGPPTDRTVRGQGWLGPPTDRNGARTGSVSATA